MKGKGGHRGIGGDASKRRLAVRVKTARRRSSSSAQWLQRQLNDPYVAEAKDRGFRSRAAFKLLQLDEKFHLLRPHLRVVDLGAAPGGWSQVAAKKIGEKGKIIALDLLPLDPLNGVTFLQMDFMDDEAPEKLKQALGGQADLVLSDMAPSTTGHSGTDHLRIMDLAEHAVHFAMSVLAKDGVVVCKYFQGGAEKELLDSLKKSFAKVRHAKPAASRADSSESFIVAMGFRGQITPPDN
ncbi:MAG: RlmE family RNA methyltransferase [Alphaproteobacteria bacterium]|nr:RlmE family RNA methyltransferase [Alphaproteobacteria bacterium]